MSIKMSADTMEPYIGMTLTALVGAWIGSFYGAYLKKKGENIALQEDIAKLVDQVEAVTQATKTIEAKISNEMWERQKRWEIKRDALFEAIKELANVEHSLPAIYSLALISQKAGQPDSEHLAQQKAEAVQNWSVVFQAFERAKLLASIVCGEEVNMRFLSTSSLLGGISSDVTAGEIDGYGTSGARLIEEIAALIIAIRRELRIDEISPI